MSKYTTKYEYRDYYREYEPDAESYVITRHFNAVHQFLLDNVVAVVTGGCSPLGLAAAEAILEAGGQVAVTGRNLEDCANHADRMAGNFPGPRAVDGFYMDITDRASVDKALADIRKEMGPPAILVNNAASVTAGNMEKDDEEAFQAGINSTIGGVYNCTMAMLKYIPEIEPDTGSIINIASMYGVVSPDPALYAEDRESASPPQYATGKGAIIQFTRYAAVHLAKKGVRVNSISPGPFPRKEVIKNKEFINKLTAKVPLGRTGEAWEIKGPVLFLASSASSFVTGHNLAVDGGWTAW